MKTLIEDLKKVITSNIENKDKWCERLINDFIKDKQTEQLPIYDVVVSLPKFKIGQTLKRKSKYTNDFINIVVKKIDRTKQGFRYTSSNDVWYYEKELLAY